MGVARREERSFLRGRYRTSLVLCRGRAGAHRPPRRCWLLANDLQGDTRTCFRISGGNVSLFQIDYFGGSFPLRRKPRDIARWDKVGKGVRKVTVPLRDAFLTIRARWLQGRLWAHMQLNPARVLHPT